MTCRLGLSDARFQWDNIAKRDATRQPASQPEADRYTKPDGRQRLFAKILALLGDSWDGRDIARCGHVRCRDVTAAQDSDGDRCRGAVLTRT